MRGASALRLQRGIAPAFLAPYLPETLLPGGIRNTIDVAHPVPIREPGTGRAYLLDLRRDQFLVENGPPTLPPFRGCDYLPRIASTMPVLMHEAEVSFLPRPKSPSCDSSVVLPPL